MTHQDKLFALASEFQDAGVSTFGIHPFTQDGICGCGQAGCKAAGKHPVIGSWQFVPAGGWSDEQFDVMHKMGHFKMGYGVSCRDLLVVDIDAKSGGIKSYESLIERVPALAGAGLIVKTGSGGGSRHLYFKAPSGMALMTQLKEYPGIDFKSGRGHFVVGPGSVHVSGRLYEIGVGSVDEIGEAPAGLLEIIKRPETVRVEYNGLTMDVSHEDVASMLEYIPNSDLPYDDFIRVGMAIHHSTSGAGFLLWDRWAQTSGKYDAGQMDYWWHHMGRSPNPVTVGTLIHLAEQNGWVRPVELPKGDAPEITDSSDLPVSIDGVDLRKPPGFVGEVAEWIASQPRRKRDNLAVGAALVAVGNHIGLRMVDERDGVTGNLLAFGVAGSGTGKESIQQAFSELHRESTMSAAVHGNIKSDAEIYRNLIRHQAALYSVDEISDFLEKLNNAKNKGGASYLDSVVATIMSVFTKASGYLLLTGDAKEDLKSGIVKEIALENKKLDDGRGSEQRIIELQKQLDGIDGGLKDPFLSMCGYGTPEKFHALMTFRAATEGFFGRAMVFEEKDPAPRVKHGYVKVAMPDRIRVIMSDLYQGGHFDTTKRRVEWTGQKIKVPTAQDAGELLDNICDWMDDKAISAANVTGLEPLYLRGYELVSKVSFVLAAPHGLRTVEHVRWAFALVMHDLELKSMLITANDRKMDAPALALQAKLMALLDKTEWMATGVIRNRSRGYKPEDIDGMLQKMVDAGSVVCEVSKHPVNGKETRKYRRK